MLIIVHKEGTLAFKPNTMCFLLVSIDICPFAVHFAVFPLTNVRSTVWPSENSLPVPFVIEVVSFVDSTVRPCVLTFAIHIVILPLANVLTSIEPLVRTCTLHLVAKPVTRVKCTIRPEVCTKAVLFAFLEMSIKARAISPAFYALAVIQVILPLSNVAFFAVHRFEVSKTVRLVI